MPAHYIDILRDLKKKQFKPVYFLYGDEPYFIDKISDYIEDHVLDEAEKSFNQTVLYGRETNAGEIIEVAKRFPMMAEHQVVIIKEAQSLNAKEFGNMEGYFANPVNSTILVFCHKYKKPDSRKKFMKAVKKTGVVFESKRLYENQVPKWIQDYVESHKMKISPKSTVMLTEFLGNDLQKISNEIDKLEVVLGEGGNITPEVIEENIGISKDFNIFELQKALAVKDNHKAHQIAQYFGKNQKTHPIFMTLPTLTTFFAKVLTIQMMKHKSADNVASTIKVNRFFVDDYIHASRNYSATKVTDIISDLRTYDLKTKGLGSTGTPEGELLKELIYKILN